MNSLTPEQIVKNTQHKNGTIPQDDISPSSSFYTEKGAGTALLFFQSGVDGRMSCNSIVDATTKPEVPRRDAPQFRKCNCPHTRQPALSLARQDLIASSSAPIVGRRREKGASTRKPPSVAEAPEAISTTGQNASAIARGHPVNFPWLSTLAERRSCIEEDVKNADFVFVEKPGVECCRPYEAWKYPQVLSYQSSTLLDRKSP